MEIQVELRLGVSVCGWGCTALCEIKAHSKSHDTEMNHSGQLAEKSRLQKFKEKKKITEKMNHARLSHWSLPCQTNT